MDTIKQPRLQEYFSTYWYGLTLLIVVTVVLAGCGTDGSTSGKPTVTIGYIAGGAEPERIDTAKDLFSKRLNANVQVKYFDSGPAALAAISSGALQIVMGIGNPPTVSAISHGVPIDVVWAMETTTTSEGLIMRDSSGIKTVKNLEGKTVALVEGSTSQLAFGAVLAKAGVNPSTVHLLK